MTFGVSQWCSVFEREDVTVELIDHERATCSHSGQRLKLSVGSMSQTITISEEEFERFEELFELVARYEDEEDDEDEEDAVDGFDPEAAEADAREPDEPESGDGDTGEEERLTAREAIAEHDIEEGDLVTIRYDTATAGLGSVMERTGRVRDVDTAWFEIVKYDGQAWEVVEDRVHQAGDGLHVGDLNEVHPDAPEDWYADGDADA